MVDHGVDLGTEGSMGLSSLALGGHGSNCVLMPAVSMQGTSVPHHPSLFADAGRAEREVCS